MADPQIPLPTDPKPHAPDWITAISNTVASITGALTLAIVAWAASRFGVPVTTATGQVVTAVPVVPAPQATTPNSTPPPVATTAPLSTEQKELLDSIRQLIAALSAKPPVASPSAPATDPVSRAARAYQETRLAQLRVTATKLRSGAISPSDAWKAYNDGLTESWGQLRSAATSAPDLADALERAAAAQEGTVR